MKFLRTTLSAVAFGLLALAGACVESDSASEAANATEIYESVMPKAPQAPGQFSITRAPDGQWQFAAIGDKGETILASELYTTKVAALNGILSVEENGVDLDNYEVTTTPEGEFAFVLKAGNGQVIADSGLFRTQDEATTGIVAARDLVAGIIQYKAAITKGARFDLWRADDKKWYFVLRAEDGKELLDSQSYKARTGALTGLESVRLNGKDPSHYTTFEDNGQVYFNLKAGNGVEIAVSSDGYASEDEAKAAITAMSELLKSERVASPW